MRHEGVTSEEELAGGGRRKNLSAGNGEHRKGSDCAESSLLC